MSHRKTIITAASITLITLVALPMSGWQAPVAVLGPLVAMAALMGLAVHHAKSAPPFRAGLAVLLGSVPLSTAAVACGFYMNQGWSAGNSSVWIHLWLIAMAIAIAVHAGAILMVMWWKHSMTDGANLG
jgi:hypothetical protein